MEEFFKLCPNGYPCVLGLNYKQDTQKGYKVLFRSFSAKDLTDFVQELLDNRRAFVPFKQNREIPPIVAVGSARQQDK